MDENNKSYKDNFVNGLELGGFFFDVFETENGGLGFTVYEKGIDGRIDEDCGCVDIFVNPDLTVKSL